MVQHSQSLSNAVTRFIPADGRVLEIAPYFDPFVAKSAYKVDYTDYIDTADIRKKAAENPELASREIPAVDFVWHPGKRLAECVPSNRRYDSVIASHVVEHIPNPIGWLNEILEVVNVGGHVILFAPDRRYTSDYFRRETDFAQLIQWWMERPTVATPGQVLDFMSNAFHKTHDDASTRDSDGRPLNVAPAYSDESILDISTFVYNERQYMDIHCTVWNADTIGSLFQRLSAIGVIGAEVASVDPDEGEFAITLRKTGEPSLLPPPLKELKVEDSPLDTRIESLEHQMGMLRHDLTFLIQMVHQHQNQPQAAPTVGRARYRRWPLAFPLQIRRLLP